MAQELPGEFATVTLFTTINRQGTLHLWPVKLPGPDGQAKRMAPFGGGGSRTGDEEMGASYCEHVARRL